MFNLVINILITVLLILVLILGFLVLCDVYKTEVKELLHKKKTKKLYTFKRKNREMK